MKKLFFLACAASLSATLLAAGNNTTTQQVRHHDARFTATQVDQTRIQTLSPDWKSQPKGLLKAPKATKETYELQGNYITSPVSFFAGTPLNLANINQAGLIVPYRPDAVTYQSSWIGGGSWKVGGQEVKNDESGEYQYPLDGQIGYYELPVYQNNSITSQGDTYNFTEFQYGRLFTSYYADYGFTNNLEVAAGWNFLTKCQILTEIEFDEYVDDAGQTQRDETYGSNAPYRGLGWATETDRIYLYGTDMWLPTDEAGLGTERVSLDTIFAIIQNDDVLNINALTMGVYGIDFQNVRYQEPVINHLKATLYPVTFTQTAEGTEYSIDWEHPYGSGVTAKSSSTFQPYQHTQGSTNLFGTLILQFTAIDPITGTEEPTNVTVDGDFVVVFTEFNDEQYENDFGFITDGYVEAPFYATTFVSGTSATTGESYTGQVWRSPLNILVNFYALYPTILDLPEEITIGLGGETKDFVLTSNVQFEEIGIDGDLWVEVDGENTTEIIQGTEYFSNEITLHIGASATTEPREGELILNALGKEYTIKVIQEGETALQDTKFQNDGKYYNVLGQEVGEDYKGVVIHNGQKLIR